jgi:hypothetical protein
MTKDEVQKMFKAYFDGLEAIYAYFEVKKIDVCNYELQLNEDNWAVVEEFGYDKVHWAIPDGLTEGTYVGDVHGLFRKEYYTLIFSPSSTGDAGFAHIFDNENELKDFRTDSDE